MERVRKLKILKKHFKLWRVCRRNFCAGFITAFPAEPDVPDEEIWLMAPILRKMHLKNWYPYRELVAEWDEDFTDADLNRV